MGLGLINTQDTLIELCAHLDGQDWVALDTEFMREKTYFPQLCLIQLATPDVVACVDPLALSDLRPLMTALYRPQLLKVLHSARQDQEIFFGLTGKPLAPVFDTQIAAALTGHDTNIGYAALVKSVTGTHLPKAHTRANWAARPLAPGMLDYAADDVRHLRALYTHFRQSLSALGRQQWLQEDCERLTDPALYANDPDLAYLRIKKGHALPPDKQPALRELAAWRESTARQHDLPRNWVLRDAILLELARAVPQTTAQLQHIPGLDKAVRAKWGVSLLAAIARGQSAEPARLWQQPHRMTPEEKRLRDEALDEMETVAAELGMTPAAIASRNDIKQLVLGNPPAVLLQGWRYELIGKVLLARRNNAAAAPSDDNNVVADER